MIWVDLIIVGVLLLGLGIGARRGFLQTLGGIAAIVVSFIGAGIAAAALSGTVARWIRPLLEKKITAGAADESAASLVEQAGFFGDTARRLTDSITALVQQTSQSLITAVTDGIAQSVAYALVYLVAFVVLMLLCRLVLRALRLASRIPGLHLLDLLGGGVLGLGVAALLLYFAAWLLLRLQLVLTEDMVAQSALLRFFVDHSPMDWFTSL